MNSDQNTNVGGTLNDLIEICLDGHKGFESAANGVDDAALKSELMGYAAERQRFASQLQGLVSQSGESPEKSGTIGGAMHRGWMNLKTALSTNDRHAILAECERGEDSAVASYRKTLDVNLPGDSQQVVRNQYASVLRTHDRIKALRDSAKM